MYTVKPGRFNLVMQPRTIAVAGGDWPLRRKQGPTRQ